PELVEGRTAHKKTGALNQGAGTKVIDYDLGSSVAIGPLGKPIFPEEVWALDRDERLKRWQEVACRGHFQRSGRQFHFGRIVRQPLGDRFAIGTARAIDGVGNDQRDDVIGGQRTRTAKHFKLRHFLGSACRELRESVFADRVTFAIRHADKGRGIYVLERFLADAVHVADSIVGERRICENRRFPRSEERRVG